MVGLQPVQIAVLIRSLELGLHVLNPLAEEGQVPIADRRCFTGLLEMLGCELPDRLQEPVATVGEANEALVDERLQAVDVGVTDFFCRLQRAAATEDGQAGEELLLLG